MTGGPCDCLTGGDVLAAVPGLTYRQLIYWTTQGRVHAHRHPGSHGRHVHRDRAPADVADGGSGQPISWPRSEVDVLRDVHLLVADTAMRLDVAFRLARARTNGLDLGDITLMYRRTT